MSTIYVETSIVGYLTDSPIFSSPVICCPQMQRQMLNTSPWLPPLG